ncbi:MAG: hypothetical protein JSR60_05345 [Proteobacteria bacterium]|nr:hypothetical protein [Pseudomonadota bacterium]
MNPSVASDKCADDEVIESLIRLAWNKPRMRRQPARDAQADHGESHFDGIGFS